MWRKNLSVFVCLALTATVAWGFSFRFEVDRQALLGEIRGLLDAGDWQDAAKKVARAEKKILHKDDIRPSDREDLAKLALYHAVAAVNLGHLEEAEWFWYLSYGLDVPTAWSAQPGWGEARAVFDRIPIRDVGDPPHGTDEIISRYSRAGFEEPRPPTLEVPESIPETHHVCTGSRSLAAVSITQGPSTPRVWTPDAVRVEIFVDSDGRPRAPRVIGRVEEPMLVYSLFVQYFEREWEPARVDGEPVPSLFESDPNSGRRSRW